MFDDYIGSQTSFSKKYTTFYEDVKLTFFIQNELYSFIDSHNEFIWNNKCISGFLILILNP